MPSSSLPSPRSPTAPEDSAPAAHHQTNGDQVCDQISKSRPESLESTHKSSPKQNSCETGDCEPHVSPIADSGDGQPLAAGAAPAPTGPTPQPPGQSPGQEVPPLQTQSSFLMRFSSRLRMKSRLVCCIYFITTFLSLFILVLIAIIIFLYWKPIRGAIIIDQMSEQKGIDFEHQTKTIEPKVHELSAEVPATHTHRTPHAQRRPHRPQRPQTDSSATDATQ